jgi:hypothetical protein
MSRQTEAHNHMCLCDHVRDVMLPGDPLRYKLTLAQIPREYVEPSTIKVKL